MYKGLINNYRNVLPVNEKTPIISLHEGNTPLIRFYNLEKYLGVNFSIYGKFDGLNPTGSFKDRGMTLAVSKALENKNIDSVICASTGNTSASAAAYAARANLKCYVIIPDGQIAFGKLAQAIAYGAKIIQINGNFDDGMAIIKNIAEEQSNICVVNSLNPFRIQGQKTISYEIFDQLGNLPDYHFLPVGNAGNINAHWIGYKEISGQSFNYCKLCSGNCEYMSSNKNYKLPVIIGYQAIGAAPLATGKPFNNPCTIATAIKIGNPVSSEGARVVVDESSGWFATSSDEEIVDAQKILAKKEGVFCEPASAISISGLIKEIENKKIDENSTVVCTLTGNGLKDPDLVMRKYSKDVKKVEPNFKSVKNILTNI